MGDFLGGLFGSGGEEGTPGEIVDVTPRQFEELRPFIRDLILGIFDEEGIGFPGELVAPIRADELDIVELLGNRFGKPGENFAAGQDLLGRTIAGDFLDPASNPFLAATIEAAVRPARAAFEEDVLPALQLGFAGAGQQTQASGSSPFVREVRQAGRDLENTIADTAARISAQNLARERAIQAQAPSQVAQVEAQQINNLVNVLQAQALPRLIEDLGVERGLQEFQLRLQRLLAVLGIGADIASPTPVLIPPTGGEAGAAGGLGDFLLGTAAVKTAFG
ncbi:MAG: hypothetical protein ACR2QC_07735 [Gammaproteobacteria bacterium]